ncbi:hypothetical protein VMCG_05102 [Cytospora schulzeri]|uniref:Arabinan endo-1,5-alpha-L-arabinosidase n=1 Tax=Cytospora schulzeri TaxID=448051 RepID=A0A423WMK2_9PEZI|nr:hypothetical protein VMCG_05102 [Valsa malicola]
MFYSRILSCLLALSITVSAYSNPEPCSGECFAQDPALIRRSSDGVYFRFNTNTYIDIMTSDTLSGPWTTVGNVLPDGSKIDISDSQALWAPMVIEQDSTYILYYSVSTLGSRNSAIGYATSTTMESGSWVDHGSIGIESTTDSDYNAIDPTMILVDGKYHLSFGSYGEDIMQVAVNSDARTINGSPSQTIYQPTGTHQVEASFPYEHDGYYYMFWSEGQANRYATAKPVAGGEYKVRVCRSSAIGGTYTDEDGTSCLEGGGNYVLESHGQVYGPGGQGILDDPTYGPIMYYRYVNTTIGYAVADYQWGWNVIDWVNGWPTI